MFHFQNSVTDWPRAVAQLPNGSLIKAIDRGDILRDVKAINPNITTALRHYGGPQNIFDGRGFEAYKPLARQFYETFIDGTFREQYARHTDIIIEWNEYLASSHTGAELQDRIDWARAAAWVWYNEYRTQADYAHIRLALLSCPVGNDIHRAFAEIALEYDCVLSYHAYDKFIGDHQRDPLSWRYHCGRWDFMEAGWGLKPDWMFGEAGPYAGVEDGWRHSSVLNGDAGAYVDAVRTWIRELRNTAAYREGRLLGFNLFTTGGTSEWRHYETRQPELDALAAMIRQEWTPPPPPPIIEPPPPPDNIPLPSRIIDYVDQLPMNTASRYWPYLTRPLSAITDIIVHHSVGQPTTPPESIAIGHINRNGGGSEGYPAIGYHFYINVDSAGATRIYKTNHLTTHSYHAGTANRSSIGVCIAGDFTTVHPSPAQLEAARFLVAWLQSVLGPKGLLKHRDVSATQCPGNTWEQWFHLLTEEPEPEPRQWSKLVYLLPQGTTREQYAEIADVAYPTRSEIAFSADSAFARPEGVTSHRVIAYDVEAWGGRVALEDWRDAHYSYDPATVTEYRDWPGLAARYASPVGTDAERASGQIWPGAWVSAATYGMYYRYGSSNQYEAYHSGDDLNLNSPSWNSDRGMRVHAMGAGVVTYARLVSGSTWGLLVVIDHFNGLCSRYAHMATMLVSEGDTVQCGDVIGTIGGTQYGVADHLHFDICENGRLLTHPTDWPGMDRARVLRDYVNPRDWLRANV